MHPMISGVRRCLAVAATLLAATLPAQSRPDLPVKHTPKPTSPAITPADLMTRLYIFADDSMLGREAGTPGNVRATEYIVRELTRLGVKPAGENGTYYQNVPLTNTRFNVDNAVMAVNGESLKARTDYHPFPGVAGLPFAESADVNGASAVFGGRLGASDAIKPTDVKGKFVVMLPPMGPNGQGDYRVWVAAEQIASYSEAAAVVVVSMEITPTQLFPLFAQTSMGLPKAPAAGKAAALVTVTKGVAERMLGGDVNAMTIGTAGTAAVSLKFAPESRPLEAPTRNVLAMIEGSDPTLKAEVVAVSAHSDHVGFVRAKIDHDSARFAHLIVRPMGVESPARQLTAEEQALVNAKVDSVRKLRPARPDSINNGADDDGSGSMGLLELAEYFQTLPTKPKRSILLAWVVAEEKGLFGSEWFGESPTIPRERIVANVNIDMIGRGAEWDIPGGGPNYLQLLGSRRLSSEYGTWVEEVNARPEFGFKFDYQFDAEGHPQQYYCRSDHYNFARWGIPTVFFSTGSHVDYHMVTDEPQYIDYPHYDKVVRFVAAFVNDVAGRAAKPVVDKAKPDPYGACRQ